MYDKDYILTLVKNFKNNPYSITYNEVDLIKDYYYNDVTNLLFIPRKHLLIGCNKKPNQIYFKSVLQNDYLVIFNYMDEQFTIAHIKCKKNNTNINTCNNVKYNNPENSLELSNDTNIYDSSLLMKNKKKIYCKNCIII